ncbi:MAG: hypothetical protein AB8B53_07970 [Flavobacteriales bacterium]
MRFIQLKHILIVVCLNLLISGCNKDESQALKSIEGDWKVVEITRSLGEFTSTSFNAFETTVEKGDLGSFQFGEDEVQYNFISLDSTYHSSTLWSLDVEKVNSGFTRVNRFALDIEGLGMYDVLFEDGTRNSEKKAEEMQWNEIIVGTESEVFLFKLEKQ